MKGLCRRKRPAPSDTDNDDCDDDITATGSQGSFREITDDNGKKHSKRRRTKGREPSIATTLMHRMEERDRAFNARIDAYISASEERAKKLETFMQEVMELESARVMGQSH
jgi:hypothetical protein